MRISDILAEAPIEISNYVDHQGPGYDDPVAVKWAQSKKAQMKVVHAFKNVPFNIKLVLADFPWRHGGVMDMQDVADAQKILPDLHPDPDAITFILTGNWLGQHPLSPWMVAHRFGHGLQGRGSLPDMALDYNYFYKWITILKEKYVSLHGYVSFDNFSNIIGTMRSARTKKLRDIGEFMHELLAQYLLTGRLTFNPIAGMDAEIAEFSAKMTDAINQTMKQLIGRIVVM